MPTINLTQIALIASKFILIGVLFSIIISYMDVFQLFISNLISSIFSSFASLDSLNLGYVAGAIGLVSFLNLLLTSLYIAGGLYMSGMVGIIIFHYTFKIYQTITNF